MGQGLEDAEGDQFGEEGGNIHAGLDSLGRQSCGGERSLSTASVKEGPLGARQPMGQDMVSGTVDQQSLGRRSP